MKIKKENVQNKIESEAKTYTYFGNTLPALQNLIECGKIFTSSNTDSDKIKQQHFLKVMQEILNQLSVFDFDKKETSDPFDIVSLRLNQYLKDYYPKDKNDIHFLSLQDRARNTLIGNILIMLPLNLGCVMVLPVMMGYLALSLMSLMPIGAAVVIASVLATVLCYLFLQIIPKIATVVDLTLKSIFGLDSTDDTVEVLASGERTLVQKSNNLIKQMGLFSSRNAEQIKDKLIILDNSATNSSFTELANIAAMQ
jgi:hypothetical protein